MPHKTNTWNSRKRTSQAERARRYLSGSGVAREDSDDELGLDDLPWEWIHQNQGHHAGHISSNSADHRHSATTANSPPPIGKRKRSHGATHDPDQEIVGA